MTIRKEVSDILSKHYCNNGINVTSTNDTAIDEIVDVINTAIMEGVGWMYCEACNYADNGVDIRKVEMPIIIAEVKETIHG